MKGGQCMAIATRRSTAVIAVLMGIVLAIGLLAIPQTARASAKGNEIAKMAVSISYSHTVYINEGKGTKLYMLLCKGLAKNGYYAKNLKQMQCNVPVALAVKYTIQDAKFPTGNKEMYNYMKKSKKWKCLGNYNGKASSLKPGDILIRIGGVTSYIGKDGKTHKAETNHACLYVGKKIANLIYKRDLKGTDADKGKPGKSRIFVSAHTSRRNAAKRSAACLEKASAAYADRRMIVFRYAG